MSKVDLTELRKGGADSKDIAVVRTGSPEDELFRSMGYKPVAEKGKSPSKPAPKRAKRKTTAKKRVSKKST